MTVPKGFQAATQKVSDFVREMFPKLRYSLSPDEARLGIHLRGNKDLLEALTGIVRSRIAGRASLPEPSDPMDCKSMVARDRELQWLLSRLEFVYRSPLSQPADDRGEQPE